MIQVTLNVTRNSKKIYYVLLIYWNLFQVAVVFMWFRTNLPYLTLAPSLGLIDWLFYYHSNANFNQWEEKALTDQLKLNTYFMCSDLSDSVKLLVVLMTLENAGIMSPQQSYTFTQPISQHTTFN